MKKIFTLMAAFATACSAWAIAPHLLFGAQPVESGKTYQTPYEVEDMGIFKIYTQDSNLFIQGEEELETTVEVTASQDIAVCSLDGLCVNSNNVTKVGFVTAEPESLEIHYTPTPEFDGVPASEYLHDITVKVKTYYTATPADYVETTVIMTNKSAEELAGISAVTLKGSVKMLNAKTLEYNLDDATKLDIYNTAGTLVISQLIKGHGTVSLDALHPGVYIYCAGGHIGKVLIRK